MDVEGTKSTDCVESARSVGHFKRSKGPKISKILKRLIAYVLEVSKALTMSPAGAPATRGSIGPVVRHPIADRSIRACWTGAGALGLVTGTITTQALLRSSPGQRARLWHRRSQRAIAPDLQRVRGDQGDATQTAGVAARGPSEAAGGRPRRPRNQARWRARRRGVRCGRARATSPPAG